MKDLNLDFGLSNQNNYDNFIREINPDLQQIPGLESSRYIDTLPGAE